jgi:glycosyltransferase involved in cell wall biosynthesis
VFVRSRFGAFVMTYNRPDQLAATVASMLAQSRPPDHVLIVDNGSDDRSEAVSRQFGRSVAYHRFDDNRGPAGAAAYAIARLAASGFDWIGWFDDDDPPQTSDALDVLIYLGAAHRDRPIGAVGAVGSRWNWETGRLVRLTDEELHGTLSVDAIGGSSQLVLSRAAVAAVGLPNPDLFFGLEEIEYCLRFRRAGFHLLVDGSLMKRYRTARGRRNVQVARRPIPRVPYHSIWRQYYTTRNYIFLTRQQFGRPDLARREAARSFLRVLSCWARGPRYGGRFSHLQLQAIVDGYTGRLGRRVTPPASYKPPRPAPTTIATDRTAARG